MQSKLSTVAPKREAALARAGIAKYNEAALAAARLATETCNLDRQPVRCVNYR